MSLVILLLMEQSDQMFKRNEDVRKEGGTGDELLSKFTNPRIINENTNEVYLEKGEDGRPSELNSSL